MWQGPDSPGYPVWGSGVLPCQEELSYRKDPPQLASFRDSSWGWLPGDKLSEPVKGKGPSMLLSLKRPGMLMSRPSCQLETWSQDGPVSQVTTPLRCPAALL